jgi:hypothetical protein
VGEIAEQPVGNGPGALGVVTAVYNNTGVLVDRLESCRPGDGMMIRTGLSSAQAQHCAVRVCNC